MVVVAVAAKSLELLHLTHGGNDDDDYMMKYNLI